jgi:hypothetical protein
MCTGWVLVGAVAALHESHCCEAVIEKNHSSELFDVNTRNVFARTGKYLLADNTVCIMCAAQINRCRAPPQQRPHFQARLSPESTN